MKKIIFLLAITLIFTACKDATKDNGKLNIVTTTTMLTDLVQNIGSDMVNTPL